MFVFWVWDALAGYWVWDASLLDALRAIGYGTLRYWRWAMGDGVLAMGYWRWAIGDERLDAP